MYRINPKERKPMTGSYYYYQLFHNHSLANALFELHNLLLKGETLTELPSGEYEVNAKTVALIEQIRKMCSLTPTIIQKNTASDTLREGMNHLWDEELAAVA